MINPAHGAGSAVRWTTVATIARVGSQVAQVAVLARILAPADFGLMALVTVVIGYAALFADMGLSTAFIQRQQISNEERSGVYWLSVAIGVVLAAIIMLASPLVAASFNEPRLIPLLSLVATNFIANALGQQLRIGAEKRLLFQRVAIIEIVAAGAGFVTATTTAWLGWGVYALVMGSMAGAWTTSLLCWLLLSNGWRPALRLRWSEVRWYLRFGGAMVLNNAINHINLTADLLLGGRLLGMSELGLYSVPRNLLLQVQFMTNPIFTRVGFPLIASVQHDVRAARRVYLTIMNLTASANAPIYIAVVVFAPEIVELFLGDRWRHTAQLFRILAVWGLFRSFLNPAGSLLFGLGHVRLSIYWNIGLLLVGLPAIGIGSIFGAQGMALALAMLMVLLFLPNWAILIHPTCGAGLWEYTRQVCAPTFCAVIAGAGAWWATAPLDGTYLRMAVGVLTGLSLYIVTSWWLNRSVILMLLRKQPV